jgi:hypothetical protein
MRHNQNGRRFRGRNGGSNNGGHHNNHGGGGHNNGGQRRSVNPRIQTFDSNGPDVRVRGNATQINEKYVALARDAMSAGDRVLAESYLQHAEHYQRMLNEMNEEFARNNPQAFQQQQQQLQQQQAAAEGGEVSVEQPVVEMNDLDQAFLVGDRRNGQAATNNGAAGTNGAAETAEGEQQAPARHQQQRQGRAPRQPKEAESA